MSFSLRAAAAAVGILCSPALPASALANGGGRPQSLSCTGVVAGGTYSSLTVPPGQFCYLSNATILGNATVQSTASLELDQSGTISGNVLVNNQAGLYVDTGWTVRGTTLGDSAAELTIQGTVHNVLANDDETLGIQNATIYGNVVSNNGVFGGAIVSSAIHGNVLINGTSPGEDGVNSTWFIAGPQLSGDEQEIDGNLVLTNNQGPIYVFYNHVHQNLICAGNNPPPYNDFEGITNTVDGGSVGQCATENSPPPSADATAQSALKAATAASKN
jgi:hypothetical protein